MQHINIFTKTRWLVTIILLTFLSVGNVWGATTANHTCSSTNGTIVSNKITWTTSSATWSSPQCRMAANSNITFTLTGVTVTKVEMGFSSTSYVGADWTSNGGGSFSTSNSTVTWTGSCSSSSLAFTTTAAARLKTIKVTYSDAPSYTITPQSNNTSYGTVSLSGTTITGSPKSGYRYASPAYSISPANSATVSQNGNAFTVTPSANTTVTINFEAIPTHTVTWSANGTTTEVEYQEGEDIEFPESASDCTGKTFVGWVAAPIAEETDDEPTFVTSANMGTSNVTYYAVFATQGGSGSVTKSDELTYTSFFAACTPSGSNTSGSYTNFSDKSGSVSDAVYAGNLYKHGNGSSNCKDYIQMRTSSNSGIITTTSGGKAKKVTVEWNSGTANAKVVNIYGKNTAYSAISDLFSDATDGDLLGTITKGTSTELTITEDYEYIGIRSSDGAIYFDAISIDWQASGGYTYSNFATTCCQELGQINGSFTFSNVSPTSVTVGVPSDYSDKDNANLEGYIFKRYSASTGGTLLETKETNSSSGTTATFNTGLVANTTYYYTIIAKHSSSSCNSAETSPRKSYTITSYTVSYAAGTGGSGTNPGAHDPVLSGTSVTLKANTFTAPAGKQFVSWNDGTNDYSAGASYSVTANKTMTAQWECVTPSISVHPVNGSCVQGGSPSALTVTATGGTLAYQWKQCATIDGSYTNAEGGSGATTASYTPPTTDAGTLYYKCEVKNTGSSCNITALSNAASFIVSAASQCVTPSFSPVGGTYSANQSVTITSTEGATIYYTTNGDEPTTSSSVYSSPIAVSANTTIKAYAVKSGMTDSEVGTAVYNIRCAQPSFTPTANTYNEAKSVTISCATEGATIYYTTDGSDPDNSSTEYTDAISVSSSQTIKAIAYKTGMTESEVNSAAYELKCAMPVITTGGTFTDSKNVELSCATEGATIRYTTDNTEPNESSAVYSTAIPVTSTTTIKAKAFKDGWTASDEASATYTIQYSVTWKVNGAALTGTALGSATTVVNAGGKVSNFPSVDDEAIKSTCGANKFMGWSASTLKGTGHSAPDDLFTASTGTKPTINAPAVYHAVFATQSGGGSTEVTDELTTSDLAATTNTYTNFTNVQGANSSAVYAGQTSLNSGMGLRGTSPAGIVSSTSGGKIKSVVINWGSNATASRTIDVYGKNSAYETAADLYSNTTAGTQAGSITYTNSTDYATTYNFTNDYDYVGIRVHSSATVIASVSFTWTSTTPLSTINYITGCCTDPATALSITNNNQVALDKTLTLASTGGNGGTVTWSVVTGTGAATISDGVLTPSSEGTITLKAHQEENTVLGTTYCDQDAEITVTILPETVNVTGVTVDPTTKAILVGETFTITPTVTPNDATDKTVSWTSNATDKATVTNAGVVEGIAAGSATITCTTTDGGKTANTAVTVYSVTVLMQDEDENDISTSGVSASATGRTLTASEGETNYKFKTWKFGTANGMTLNGSALDGTPTGNVTVIAEFYKPRVIKWSKNGNDSYAETTTKYDSKPSDIPAITSGLACAGTFIAWTDATHNNGQTAKDDASYYEGALYKVTDDFSAITAEETTFYAVFAEGGAAEVNTVMWSEDWTGVSTNSTVPSECEGTGKVVYNSATVTYTESGSDCNVKTGDSYAGGTAPELYVKANNWWKISGIPTAGAATLTLSYKSNGSLPVTTTTANVTIDERTGSSNSYSHTIHIGEDVSSFDLQFGTTNANTRLDNISVKVASVNIGNYVTECNPNEILVAYDANGGNMSLTCANGNHDKTTDYTICADAPTRNYYTFAGWSDGTNTYDAGATIPAANIDDNITLTAQWTPVPYSITYELDGGTNGANPSSYNVETATFDLADATDEHRRFGGWYDNSGFTGSAIISIALGSHGDKTFYAKWIERHEIVFEANGVTTTIYRASDENLEDAVAGQGSKPANPAAPGLCGATKEFVGWTENLLEENTDSRPTDLTDATGTVSANKHYYAVWASTTSGEKEMSFTLVPGDFPTAYPTTNQTMQAVASATDGSGATTNVELSFINVMLQSNKIQIKNTSGAGIWNTEALKDITISVTSGSNITYYRNSSAHPTGNGSTHTYFTITKNGSNTGTASSITITFKANVNYHNEYATGCHFVVENTETLDITENSELTSLVVQDGGEVNVADNKSLTLDNLTVEAGGKVSGEGNMTVNDFTIESEAGKSGQLTGSNVNVTGNLVLEIKLCEGTLDATKYYCISAPFDVDMNGGFAWGNGTTMVFNQDFQLFEYQGKKRAETGNGWQRVSGTMHKNTAYFIVFDASNENNQNVIRLKATEKSIPTASSITFTAHPSETGDDYDANWNGSANPTLHYIGFNAVAQVFDCEHQNFNPKYTSAATAEEGVNTEYGYVVGTPFFYKGAGTIMFDNNAQAYRAPQRQVEKYTYCVRISEENATRFDNQLYVMASENAEAQYVEGHDVPTMNSTTSNYGALIWTNNYGVRLAVEEAPLVNQKASYALGIFAPAAGTYTISVATPKENAELYLTKNGRICWNLTMGACEVELAEGQNNEYGLLLRAEAPQVTTGVENGELLNGANGVQKVIIDEHVYILRGEQLYGVDGKAVK